MRYDTANAEVDGSQVGTHAGQISGEMRESADQEGRGVGTSTAHGGPISKQCL